MPLIINLLAVVTIVNALCYWNNKELMHVTLLVYFFLWSFHSRNGSFGTGVLITLRLPGLHAAIP